MSNGLFTLSNRFAILTLCIFLLVSCTTADRYETGIQRFERAVPSTVALFAAQRGAWIAWAGDLSAPDLHVQPIGATQAWTFPISGAPTDLHVLPLAERRLALLWLERSAGGAPRLQVATLESDGTLRRAPFEIGAAQRYTALPTSTGSILTFLINAESLSIGLLDRLGRPYGTVRVAEAAHMAAAALDRRDQLHVTWLAPSDGALWQLLYLSFDLRLLDQSAPRLPAPTLLAVLRLAEGEYIESLSAGADPERLYILWNLVNVGRESESARLEGLSFPLESPLRSRQLDVSALPANLRQISLLSTDQAQGGAPTLVGRLADRKIVFGALAEQGVFRVQQVRAAAEGEVLSNVIAALSPNNALHLAWIVQNQQGRAALRYAAFPRPQPAVAPR
jgi:hypothetical protein